MKFAIYCRVSTSDQSTDSQLARCKQWSTDNLVSVELFRDEGESGMKKSRPEFDRMLEAIRAKKIHGVIVFSLDRLARSLPHLVSLLAEWEPLGVRLVCVAQGIDTRDTSPTAKFQQVVLAAVAQLERDMIVVRVREGQANARRKGVRFGRTPTPQTPEQTAAIAAHFEAFGCTGFRALAKVIGTDHAQAARWLRRYAEESGQQSQPTGQPS